MNTSIETKPSIAEAPAPATHLYSILFVAMGMLTFGITCLVLMAKPDLLLGDPYREAVLAVAHALILGWIGSLIFGAGYQLVPVMSGASLWSRKLPWVHLVLHVVGLVWMLAAFTFAGPEAVNHGALVVYLGSLLFVGNLMATAGRLNRYEPANLTFYCAMLWLVLSGVLAVLILINRVAEAFAIPDLILMIVHAHLGLAGFLLLALLGATLKLFTMFLRPKHQAGAASWTGCFLINIGLLFLFPAELYPGDALRVVATVAIAMGTLAYGWDILLLVRSRRSVFVFPYVTHLTGLGLLVLLLGSIVASMPGLQLGQQLPMQDWMRTYFCLALFGPFTFAIFGMSFKVAPFLAWQLRVAPGEDLESNPSPKGWSRLPAAPLVLLAALLGWGYLAAAQWSGHAVGVQLAMLLFFIAWLFVLIGIQPAARVLVTGRTPSENSGNP